MDVNANIEQNRKIVAEIDGLIRKQRLEDALEMNIRTYEEALANDEIYLIAHCLSFFGDIKDHKSENEKAMGFYQKAINLAKKYKIDDCLAVTLNNVGNYYASRGMLHNAITKYTEALRAVNEDNKDINAKLLNNIGILYLDIGEYDKPTDFFEQSLALGLEMENKLLITTAYTNLAEVYIAKKDFIKASYYNRLSKDVSEDIDDTVGVALAIANTALINSYTKKNWVSIKEMFLESLDLMGEESILDKVEIMLKYALAYSRLGNLDEAEENLEDLVAYARELSYYSTELSALKELEKIYIEKKRFEKAYELVRRQLEINENSYEHWKKLTVESVDKDLYHNDTGEEINDLQKSVKTLKSLSEVGRKVTACRTAEQIFNILGEEVAKTFGYDTFGVGIKSNDGIKIDYRFIDDNSYQDLDISVFDDDYLMAICIKRAEEIIVYDTKDLDYNKQHFDGKLLEIIMEAENRGIIFCPITFNETIIGGLTIQSNERGNLSYVDLESLRVLASYIAIAYSNVSHASDLVIANKKLEEASMLDGLTGVYNRHALGQYIGKEFIGMLESKLPSTALMIDIDYFKQYNDNYGHVMGDKALKLVCGSLRNSLSGYQHKLFRYGGDEFFVIIEHCGFEEAKILLTKIQIEMKQKAVEHVYSKIENYVTLTIGACVINNAIKDYTIVFNAADEALYVAKDAGRNQYSINNIS